MFVAGTQIVLYDNPKQVLWFNFKRVSYIKLIQLIDKNILLILKEIYYEVIFYLHECLKKIIR